MFHTTDDDRFTRALKSSHTVTTRVEVWAGGEQLSDAAPFEDGAVTDEWVTGIRRHLDLTVKPSRDWLKWLNLPLLELRPFRGVRFTRSSFEECPLGRYPVLFPALSRPVGPIKIAADDYYQRIKEADFAYPVQTFTVPAVTAIKVLFYNLGAPFSGLVEPVITSTSDGVAGGVLLEKSRHDAIADYAKSFGLEVFIDRMGVPTIADARVLGDAETELLVTSAGFIGNGVEGFVVTPDASKVFNQISVTSSAQGVEFPAQQALITDPEHPAAQWRIGVKVKKFSSPLLLTPEAAMKAAQTILAKASGAAVTYNYTGIPDPRRDAGDSILGATMGGSTISQIDTVTHPLKASGRQQVTTVSTQQVYELV